MTACSCGDDDDSGGSGGPVVTEDDDVSSDDDDLDDDVPDDDTHSDDDLDDDLDDDADDDVDDDTGDDDLSILDICVEEWDDIGECPRGFLTPDGACIERIAGGAPGREGVSIAVGSDNLTYIAAVKGRDLRLYKIDGSGPEITCTVRTIDFMAAGPSMAMDADGHFHVAYTDLWNDKLKYATDASGTWVIESIAGVGPERRFASENLYHAHAAIAMGPDGNPHIVYVNRVAADLWYARKSEGTWTTEAVTETGDYGTHTDIAVDAGGHAHIAAMGGLLFNPGYTVYLTNADGTWADWYPSDALWPSVAIDADGLCTLRFFRSARFGCWTRRTGRGRGGSTRSAFSSVAPGTRRWWRMPRERCT
ncbi:MAG: hypothetical protein M5R36_27810 [Deltaproteobacteria bacterium]|nr:hypothetical protein [Deltaproteobacteria bacterium]